MDKIGIIGTGLIGTSLGLAIKKAGVKNVEIVGTDVDRAHSNQAHKMGAVDQVSGNMAAVAEDAEMIVIATPVTAMKLVLQVIGPRLKEGCLVTDTGSSKAAVFEWAREFLPRGVSFVGGNPIVRKDGSGPEAADASLFVDRPYCVIPAKEAQEESVRLLTDMIRAIGAKPYYMDLSEHDSFISAVTHLPLLLSVALIRSTSRSPSWDDIAKVASTQFSELTRLASGDPASHQGLFSGNCDGVVYWIDAFVHELNEIRQILEGDGDSREEAMDKVMDEAFTARARWVAGLVTPESQASQNRVKIPSPAESMSELFLGDNAARRRMFGWGPKRSANDGEKTQEKTQER